MTKAIYFDMDGTVANLYDVPNWLEKLQAQDVTPYIEAKPLIDMEELKTISDYIHDPNPKNTKEPIIYLYNSLQDYVFHE